MFILTRSVSRSFISHDLREALSFTTFINDNDLQPILHSHQREFSREAVCEFSQIVENTHLRMQGALGTGVVLLLCLIIPIFHARNFGTEQTFGCRSKKKTFEECYFLFGQKSLWKRYSLLTEGRSIQTFQKCFLPIFEFTVQF